MSTIVIAPARRALPPNVEPIVIAVIAGTAIRAAAPEHVATGARVPTAAIAAAIEQ